MKNTAREIIKKEIAEVKNLLNKIDEQFVKACELMLECEGRIIVIGMGKSGHIARKIAATFSSTGTPSFFVHPGEASHGDLGMITYKDIVLALSNSGETNEILTILPLIKRLGITLISLTGKPKSTLAKNADINIDVSITEEACPLGLAPTSSTTTALVMGDALAGTLLDARGFTSEDFAISHPSGSLGKQLLLKVDDIMHTGNDIPTVLYNASLSDTLLEMSRKKLGMTAIVTSQNTLKGIVTDGDLRRALDRRENIYSLTIDSMMTQNPITIKKDELASTALRIMEENDINGLIVIDDDNIVIGALNMLDMLHSGII